MAEARRAGRVLVLAGTPEAARLCRALAADGVEVVASYAGVADRVPELPCAVRVGGFGGVDGLTAWLAESGVSAVVDATSAGARRMPGHAVAGCAALGLPRLRLRRPPWTAGPADRWVALTDLAAASAAVADLGAAHVLLAVGTSWTAWPRPAGVTRLVVRTFRDPMAPTVEWAPLRPPLTLDDEVALLRRHDVQAVVSRNAGGAALRAKVDAARHVGVPVVMLRRPPDPPGPVADDVPAALAWLRQPR